MTKTNFKRVDETIEFLEHLPANIHQFAPAAGNALRKFNIGTALDVVSQSMSLGAIAPHLRAQMQSTRHARRALILVRAVLGNEPVQMVRKNVDLIQDGALLPALGAAINKWVIAEQPKLTPSFNDFNSSTETFLTNNSIFVDSKGGPGAVNYYWGWDELNKRYKATGDMTSRTPLVVSKPVFHIPTTLYSDVQGNLGNIPSLKVTRSPGITTQLTGCAYIFHIDSAGELYAAHIWPKGTIQAIKLCSDLRTSAGLVLAPGNVVKPEVFGACPKNNGLDYKHTGTKTYIVATGGPGNWEIHIQQQVGGGRTHWRVP